MKLNYILIVFASFATANRVKSLLYKNYNINSEIMQTPGAIKVKSCSYCLKLKYEHMNLVWNIVTQNGLSSKGIFSNDNYTKLK